MPPATMGAKTSAGDDWWPSHCIRPNERGPHISREFDRLSDHKRTDRSVVSSMAQLSSTPSAGIDAVLSLAGAAPGGYRLRLSISNGVHTSVRKVGLVVK